MVHQVVVRKAIIEEIDWINAQYDKVDFKHSVYENEHIAIAESDGQRIGLGRLQYIEDGVGELGGMYVNEEYRRFGVAHKIVEYLIKNSQKYRIIYCIPFSHLDCFYRQFGFVSEKNLAEVPRKIVDKYSWCQSAYESPTVLLVINRT
ncbi:MAG TPA: GNAT family N-acetyltransferase [Syntrophales bacterium]|nr:GNAT family N-acetyltransferase [Syntrophales bacterium]HPQ43463.1 GNAT family N-acetyltransferase [Syntrophales bacterium]